MHTYLKVLTGVGIAGSIGGGGYAISTLLSSSNNEIADKLVKEGYKILGNTTENNAHWKEILGNYKTLSKSNPKLKFGTFAGTEDKAEEELAKLCQELLKPNTYSDAEEQDNYKKAEKWCVVPVTVSAILKERGYTSLSTADGDGDKAKWEGKVKAIKAQDGLTIDGLTLDNSRKTEVTPTDIINIKAKCATIGSKKNHESEYDNNLKLFSNWCSNKAKVIQ